MRKLKIYLDTSVLSFYFAEDEPEKMRNTKEFFKRVKKEEYDAFISAVVI
ncbi:MAG: hypothetical protein AB1485_05720 [Candidatus Thermoplasmatota archaeon]